MGFCFIHLCAVCFLILTLIFLRERPSRSLENLLLRNGLAGEKRRHTHSLSLSLSRDAPFCMRSGCLYLRLPREAPRVSRRVSLDFLPEDVQTGPYWFDGSIYRLSRSAHELALENLLGDASDYSRVAATTRQSPLLYYRGGCRRESVAPNEFANR